MGKQKGSSAASIFNPLLGGEKSCHRAETRLDDRAVLAKTLLTAVVGKKQVIPVSED